MLAGLPFLTVVPVIHFILIIMSVNITSKCILTGELLNMEKGISVSFLNDTHSFFNFTMVCYKLCFNGAGVLINPNCSLLQALSFPSLLFHITYLLDSGWLMANDDICQQWLEKAPNHQSTDSAIKLPLLCTEVCVCALSLRCLFSISPKEDPKKI